MASLEVWTVIRQQMVYRSIQSVSNETIESIGTDENAALISLQVLFLIMILLLELPRTKGGGQFQLLWCRSCCSGNRWYCLCER